jgi:hypothetical protein
VKKHKDSTLFINVLSEEDKERLIINSSRDRFERLKWQILRNTKAQPMKKIQLVQILKN